MPEIIFDCCCISNFALSDSLFVLEKLSKKSALVTNFVSAEIMRGIQLGHRNLAKITEALKEGRLREADLKGKKERSLYETLSVSLGLGEASSLAVAKVRRFVFASDDKAARREAILLGVKLTGTIGLLKKAVWDKIINLKEGDLILTRMKEKGFYSSVKSFGEI